MRCGVERSGEVGGGPAEGGGKVRQGSVVYYVYMGG
jgi:hypothetical protein